MYRMIVAHQVRKAWSHLQRGDWPFIVDSLADDFTYRFVGDTAIGGTRHTKAAMAEWFERLFRLFPDLRFEVRDVLVAGWPWRTRAVVLVGIQATVEGEPYENELAQRLEIRWGKITRVTNLEDTQKLERALARIEAGGVEEAGAAPIDESVPAAA
jgi:ketosteroid isomerase-like protein